MVEKTSIPKLTLSPEFRKLIVSRQKEDKSKGIVKDFFYNEIPKTKSINPFDLAFEQEKENKNT